MHDAEVTALDIHDDEISGVISRKGKFHAEQVVIAGGAWSSLLLREAGFRLAVKPVRGQMIMYKASPLLLQHIVLSEGRYVIPRRDGRVLVGSTLEDVGYDKSTTTEARESLQEAAMRLVPGLAAFPVERHWSGLRPGSPHGVPFIGKYSKIKGLYINAGHYRNGVVLGPASCRLVADIMLEREANVEAAPYSPDRVTSDAAGEAEIDDSGHKIDFV
jgi:glycine oxidase